MRSKLGRHLGSLSLAGVSVSLLGCFDESSKSAVPSAAPSGQATVAVVVPETPPTEPKPEPTEAVPEKLAEIVKLVEAKVAPEVILAYIHREERDYDLTADEVILLRKRGADDGIIAAMVRKPVVEPPAVEEPTAPVASVAVEPAPQMASPLANPVAPQAPEPPANVVTQYVAAVESQAPVTVEYFNTYLAPHGTWVDVAEYGRCWRPTIVTIDRSWKPYCNGGRWVWSNHGWYWQSDYSWGWAAFHYGRWCNDRGAGWVWVPGSVWAPAWVSWRKSKDYCGWAPLPPAAHYSDRIGLTFRGKRVGVDFDFGLSSDSYSFVESKRLDDHGWHRHRLGPRETDLIFAKTKPVNRYEQGHRGLVHRGVDEEWFGRGADRRERIPVRLDDIAEHDGRRPDQWREQGRSLAVYRPDPTDRIRQPRPEPQRTDLAGSPRLHINGKPTDPTPPQRSAPAAWQTRPRAERPAPAPAPMRPSDAIANPTPDREFRPSRPEFPRVQQPVAAMPEDPLPENGPVRPSPGRGIDRERRIGQTQPVVPPKTPAEALPRRNPPTAETVHRPRFTPMQPQTSLPGQNPSRNPINAGRLQRPAPAVAPPVQRPQAIQRPQTVPQTAIAPRFAPPATTPPPRTAPAPVAPRVQSAPAPAVQPARPMPNPQRSGQPEPPPRNGNGRNR